MSVYHHYTDYRGYGTVILDLCVLPAIAVHTNGADVDVNAEYYPF